MDRDTPTTAGHADATPRMSRRSTAAKSVWSERASTRAAEIRTLAASAQESTDQPPAVADALAQSIAGHLVVAEDAARMSASLFRSASSALRERTATHLNAAEIEVLLLAPPSAMRGYLPDALARVRTNLDEDDPRRVRLEEIAAEVDHGEILQGVERDAVLGALRAANREESEAAGRASGLRTVLHMAIMLVTVGAVTFALLGVLNPDALPLCFVSTETSTVSCPAGSASFAFAANDSDFRVGAVEERLVSSWDIVLVELVGMFAAAVAAAVALRGFENPRDSHQVALLLALLKLPTGALTAVLGLLLLRAGLVPGFSTLDSPAQIIAWAVILGYSQQLFTKLVDQRAQEVIKP